MEKITVELAREVAQFFGRAPSLEAIIAYKLPDKFDDYLQLLMDKNSDGTISPQEYQEQGEFLDILHILTMIQLNARLYQRDQAANDTDHT